MRRSLIVAGIFAIGAMIVTLPRILGGSRTILDWVFDAFGREQSWFDKVVFYGCFWPMMAGQRFLPQVDGFFFILFAWILIGLLVGCVWQMFSVRSLSSPNQTLQPTAGRSDD